MSSVCSWRRMSIASSWVMMPTSMSDGVDDGDGEQVVLVDLAGDRLLVLVDPGEDDVALHDVLDHGRAARQDQPLERDEADQPALVVDDVAVIDRLAVGRLVAEPFEGLADGDVRRERDVVGRHDARRRSRARSWPGGGCPRARPGRGYGRIGSTHVLVEPVDQVGALVVRHQVQQLGGLRGRHRLDEPDLAVGVEVAEHLGAVAGRAARGRGRRPPRPRGPRSSRRPGRGGARRRSRAGRRARRRGSARGGRGPAADFALGHPSSRPDLLSARVGPSIARSADHVLADEGPQDLGDVDPAVGPLVVLQDRDQGPAEGDGRAVERVDEPRPLLAGGR